MAKLFVVIIILSCLLVGFAGAGCTETDQQMDYYTYGTCTDSMGIWRDYCSFDLAWEVEYSCGASGCEWVGYNCRFGCLFGKCIRNPSFIPLTNMQGATTSTSFKSSSTIPRTTIVSTTILQHGGSLTGTLKFFYTDSCGWCSKEKPVIEQVEREFSGIAVERIYATTGNSEVQKYSVSGIPVSVFIQPGCTKRQVGYLDYIGFVNWLKNGECNWSE